jgi:hypothetical protein
MFFEKINRDFYNFFETWYEHYHDEDNFDEYICLNEDEVIEQYIEENELDESDLKPDEKEKIIEEKRRSLGMDYLENLSLMIEEKFESKAQIKGDYIRIFRDISVRDPKVFIQNLKNNIYVEGFDGLGVYWSYDHHSAEAHWGYDGGEIVTISALVKIEDLDLEEILMINLSPSLGYDEAEVCLKEGTVLRNISVEINSDSEHIEIDLVA